MPVIKLRRPARCAAASGEITSAITVPKGKYQKSYRRYVMRSCIKARGREGENQRRKSPRMPEGGQIFNTESEAVCIAASARGTAIEAAVNISKSSPASHRGSRAYRRRRGGAHIYSSIVQQL